MDIQQKLITLLNEANPTKRPMSVTEVSFGLPQISNGQRNTEVTITAVAGSGFTGERTLFYDRLDLGTNMVASELYSETAFEIDDILDRYRILTDVAITLDDVTVSDFSGMQFGDALTIAVTAKANSLAWVGEKEISLVLGLPPNVDEVYQLMNFTLPNELNE